MRFLSLSLSLRTWRQIAAALREAGRSDLAAPIERILAGERVAS